MWTVRMRSRKKAVAVHKRDERAAAPLLLMNLGRFEM